MSDHLRERFDPVQTGLRALRVSREDCSLHYGQFHSLIHNQLDI